MEDVKKQTIHLEDGRKADKIVQELSDPNTGISQIVTEVHAEPVIEKKLCQRVIETKKPVIVRREIEVIDEVTGEIVKRTIESSEPEARMEVREQIHTNATVAALNAKNDCDCYVTQEDMQKTFSDGFMAVARALSNVHEAPVTMQSADRVSMQSIVGEKIEGAQTMLGDWQGTILWSIVGVLSAGFAYVVFFM